jgi:tetratricopeptide (TPR) repeat protein
MDIDIKAFFDNLGVVAKSPYAFLVYLGVIIAWVYAVTAQARLNKIAKVITSLPEKDRAALLAKEYSTFPRSGLTAKDWIRSRIYQQIFLAFIALVIAATVLAIVALTLKHDTEQKANGKVGSAENAEKIKQLLSIGKSQQSRGEYAEAWESLGQAAGLNENAPELCTAQEDLVMAWLENIRKPEGQTFSSIVTKITPILDRGLLTAAEPRRKADLQAHIGWAAFLRSRDTGESTLQPEEEYRKALSLDPDNPYAHVMLGHWILWRNKKDMATARQHFDAAIAAGREEDDVRKLQLAALGNASTAEAGLEMIGVANAMRKKGQPVEPDYKSKIWSVYYWFLRDSGEYKTEKLLGVLPPEEHLATFQWLFENTHPYEEGQKMYYTGLLHEACGRRAEALQTFKSLSASLAGEFGTLPTLARAAVERLSKP